MRQILLSTLEVSGHTQGHTQTFRGAGAQIKAREQVVRGMVKILLKEDGDRKIWSSGKRRSN